jgi:hypothetical protein
LTNSDGQQNWTKYLHVNVFNGFNERKLQEDMQLAHTATDVKGEFMGSQVLP